MSPPRKKTPKARQPASKAKLAPPPEDERLDQLASQVMIDFLRRAYRDEATAFRFISLLNALADLVSLDENCPDSFLSISSRIDEWPLALSPKKQFAKERREKLGSIQKVGASSNRLKINLRGGHDLADSVMCYISVISNPGTYWLDGKLAPAASGPISAHTLQEYREKSWELFLRQYGERFENHPALKAIAPEMLQGQPVSPGKRRDIIRDAWEGAWKTIARQVAAQK